MRGWWGWGTAQAGILLERSLVSWREVKLHLTLYSVNRPESELQNHGSAEGIQESFVAGRAFEMDSGG